MGDENNNVYVENMRFYGNMRFKQLTLLMAGMTVAGAAVVQYPVARALVTLVAMGFTALLWVMEIRSTVHWEANCEKLREPWPRPAKNRLAFITATNALLISYVLLFALWWWLGYRWRLHCVCLVISLLVGVLLLVFSVLSYYPIWTQERESH